MRKMSTTMLCRERVCVACAKLPNPTSLLLEPKMTINNNTRV